MVSLKFILPTLALALQVAALPSTGNTVNRLEKLACLAPTNCSPIGNCAFCCASGVTPDSSNCHMHGNSGCPSGQRNYHCDDEH